MALTTQDLDRFWSKVERGDGCWLWRAATNPKGYGVFSLGPRRSARQVRAHRLAWEIANGTPVPDGLVVRHTCDVTACVNPAHLLLGTVADNNRDITERGRKARGERSGTARIAAAQAREIRDRLAAGDPRRALAAEFGISKSSIDNIANGRTWAQAIDMEVAA